MFAKTAVHQEFIVPVNCSSVASIFLAKMFSVMSLLPPTGAPGGRRLPGFLLRLGLFQVYGNCDSCNVWYDKNIYPTAQGLAPQVPREAEAEAEAC